MENESFADKRRFPRWAFREAVQYRLSDALSDNGSVGYDLSEGGLRFRADDFLPHDAQIQIHIQLRSEREATLQARVVWAQKVPYGDSYHIGCEFIESRENALPRFLIKNFLEVNAG